MAPCTWPSSRAGLSTVPASCTVDSLSTVTCKVSGSMRTAATSATNP